MVLSLWLLSAAYLGLYDLLVAQRLMEEEPAISSGYDVYHQDDKLIYVRDSCESRHTDAKFFVHIFPVDVNDLKEDRKQYGFDNYDFSYADAALGTDVVRRGECVIERILPEYGATHIKTGQYLSGTGRRIWEGDIYLGSP